MIVSLRERLAPGEDPPPVGGEDGRVLHLRCGTDIRDKLAAAGFRGDFLAFYDPLVHGPVPRCATLAEYLERRARYLGATLAPDYAGALADLRAQYAALERAADYATVCLWFEHDSWDQLILARLLAAFADEVARPPRLRVLSATGYPGVTPFRGLGQLWPAALVELWRDFEDVDEARLALGRAAWDALRAPRPAPLAALAASGTPALPTLAIALRRHLRELPSRANGLGLAANLVLRALAERGALAAGRLFGVYTQYYEPLPYLGDTAFALLLERLSGAAHPALGIAPAGADRWAARVALNATGRELLAGRADWIALNGIDEWLGGIHLDSARGMVYRRDE